MSDAGDSNQAAEYVSGFTVLWTLEVEPARIEDWKRVAGEMLQHYPKLGAKLLGCWLGGFGVKSNEVYLLVDYGDIETYNRVYSDPEFVRRHSELGASSWRTATGRVLTPCSFPDVEFSVSP
jgi:hypothetical protein